MKLHITNGDCTGDMLIEAEGIEGDILCWRDLLHDGPILADPTDHRQARVDYLTQLLQSYATDLADPEALLIKNFDERDSYLARLTEYEEIVLWFEHDLYDQLQLVEICQRLKEQDVVLPKMTIICIDDHPEVPVFHGLGNLTPDMLVGLYPQREELSESHLLVARNIWKVLISDVPQQLANLVQEDIPGWPFMAKALRRFCCEYPAADSGLTLTQTYILLTLLRAPDELPALRSHLEHCEVKGLLVEGETADSRYYQIITGPASFLRIFHHLQALEVDPFMGDLSIRMELMKLVNAKTPYVSVERKGEADVFCLTQAGAESLQGLRKWHQDNELELWRGGVHIGPDTQWLWDQQDQKFILEC